MHLNRMLQKKRKVRSTGLVVELDDDCQWSSCAVEGNLIEIVSYALLDVLEQSGIYDDRASGGLTIT